jgi:hypothetical protein
MQPHKIPCFYHGTNVGANSPNVVMYTIKKLKIRYVQGKARGWGWPSIFGTTPPTWTLLPIQKHEDHEPKHL